MTQSEQDIVIKCDRQMLRYMMAVKLQDGISGEEVDKRCGLKNVQVQIRQKITVIWTY